MAPAVRPHLLFNPGPTNVHDDVRRCLLAADVNHRDREFADVLALVRQGITQQMGLSASHDCIPFVASGTGANEAVIGSIHGTLAVLISGHYSARLADIGERLGRAVIRITSDPFAGVDCDALERSLAQSGEGTHVCVVHHETTTGILAPLDRIAAIAGRHGARLIVDGISSIFGHPREDCAPEIDYYTVTANKCLESVPGLSFVIARRSLLGSLPSRPSGYYFDLGRQWRDMEETGAPSFTQGYGNYLAAAAALRRLRAETVAGRSARYARLRDRLATGLASLGIEPVYPCGRRATWLHLSRRPLALDYGLLRSRLSQQGITIYTDARTLGQGHLYFATMGAIDDDDVDTLVNAIRQELPVCCRG